MTITAVDDGEAPSGAAAAVRPAPRRDLRAVVRRIGAYPNTVSLFCYGLVALAADLPLYPGDPNRLPTIIGTDIVQTTWFLELTPYDLLHGQNLFSTTLINHPNGVDIAQNTGMQLLGILTAPLTLLVSPVASLNLLRWLAFALSAYAAYWVFRQFVRWTPAAFVGGLLYGFSPYMVAQGSLHLNLTFVPLPPLILYGCFEILVTQRYSARRAGLLLGSACVAQFFISAEILATTALVCALGLFFLFFLCINGVRSRVRHAVVAGCYVALVAAPLLVYPVWMMYHGRAHYSGPAQGFVNTYNADLLGPILPTVAQLFAPAHLATIGSSLVAGMGDLSENGSYLGVPLLAVTVYLVCRFWRRLWPLYLALMAVTCFVLSLGPRLIIDGKAHHLPVNLPFEKIGHLPLFENVLPVRLSMYVVFFVAFLVVLGIDWLRSDRIASGAGPLWSWKRTTTNHLGQALGWGVALVTVLSLLPAFPYRSFPLRVNWAETPAGLGIIPRGAVVLTYPYPVAFADDAMLWQSLDEMRFNLLGGYALTGDRHGRSTSFPQILEPSTVEALLVNSVSPYPDPHLPGPVATAVDLTARTVTVLPRGRRLSPRLTADSLRGTVWSVDTLDGTFTVGGSHLAPVGVILRPTTAIVGRSTRAAGLAAIVPGARVIVSGPESVGTVNPATTALLRRFIVSNHVDTVIVELGRRDSGEIAHWFRAVLGAPNRAGGGGEIWLDASRKARTGPTTT